MYTLTTRVNHKMLCPCGSQNNYNNCCEPLIKENVLPSSAEALMRSRYTAYSIGDYQYIYDTYSTASQHVQNINDIKSWAEETTWLKLIIESEKNVPCDTVLFHAYYLHDKRMFKMTEKSLFIKENKYWRYHKGSVNEHTELPYPLRNSKCPCLSNKKFKACCGK